MRHHHLHEFGERHLRLPAQLLTGLGGVTDEKVDLGRTEELGILPHVLVPVGDSDFGEGALDEFFDGVRLARCDHVIVGLVLLEHEPHRLHVVAGVTPIALGVEVAHDHLVLKPQLDAGRRVGDLARDELDATTRTLVIEENARAGVEAVALAIVDGDVMSEHLGASVGRTWMERRHLGLRDLTHLAEHLRR